MKTYVVSNLKLRVISLQFLHEFVIPFYIYYSSYIIVHTFIHRYLFTCKLLRKSPLGALIIINITLTLIEQYSSTLLIQQVLLNLDNNIVQALFNEQCCINLMNFCACTKHVEEV